MVDPPALTVSRPPSWLAEQAAQTLFRVLGAENVRFVGGCVRDTLLGRPVGDLDAACRLAVTDTKARLEAAGVKVIPTGLKHGTLTAVFEGMPVEVTQLRVDVETDGRHATVVPTCDWEKDAERRDFTVNALYMDAQATVHDPVGGMADLEKRILRFVGCPERRLKEDALRALRYFRFLAQLGFGPAEDGALGAVSGALDGIERLSGERLSAEFSKWLAAPDPVPSLRLAIDTGLMTVMPFEPDLEGLEALLAGDPGRLYVSPTLRLLALAGGGAADVAAISDRFRLSNADRGLMQDAQAAHKAFGQAQPTMTPFALAYLYGLLPARYALMVRGGEVSSLERWQRPMLPVRASDLLAQGFQPGPKIGTLMRRIEARWIASNFTLDREALLADILSAGQGD